MTKVTTLADLIVGKREQVKTGQNTGKPIEFIKRITCDGGIDDIKYQPNEYDHVSLLCGGVEFDNEYDIIAAWDDDFTKHEKAIILGHWNDGFVEQ